MFILRNDLPAKQICGTTLCAKVHSHCEIFHKTFLVFEKKYDLSLFFKCFFCAPVKSLGTCVPAICDSLLRRALPLCSSECLALRVFREVFGF